MSRLDRTLSGLFLIFMGVTAFALTWLGAKLLWLSGSPYYFFMGLSLLVIGVLWWRKSPNALKLYGVFLFVTVIWSLWEVGLDAWALAPRLVMFLVIGLWMMSPVSRRRFGYTPGFSGQRYFWGGLGALVAAWIIFLFVQDLTSGGKSGEIQYDLDVATQESDWKHYGNAVGGDRYSPLGQITRDNVGALQKVWTFHTGPAPKPTPAFGRRPSFQLNPLKVGDKVFICTGYNDVIAIDAETGQQAWRFRAAVDDAGVLMRTCRGVTYYKVPGQEGVCSERVYTATIDARLLALDAQTGELCSDFGNSGAVDLTQGMGEVVKGYYYASSPPALVRGKLVVGGWVTDNQRLGEPAGAIRAFDAVTGEFSWAFDPGRPDQHGLPEAPDEFTRGTPNSWAPMSADEVLGLVFVPTGNAPPDYFGGHRTELDEKYSSAVLALDAANGNLRWSFQTVHHDLWDYDVGSQPVLVDMSDGTKALIQPTKRGEIFVLNRETGEPLSKVEERPVPQADMPGDWLSSTQPFSVDMPGFAGPRPTEKTMWGLTPIDQAVCRIKFRQAHFEGTFTPVQSDRPTIVWPGYLGGIDWGSVSVDPERRYMVVNSTHVANYNQLIPREVADEMGVKPLTPESEKFSVVAAQEGTPYAVRAFPFLSPIAVPCQQPPYGFLSVVDLETKEIVWQKRFGTSRDSGPLLMPTGLPIPMGVPNLGGSVVTQSGIIFIGATQEHALRAYDLMTGEELWRARLPAGAQSTPASYWSSKSQRQFIVVAAGGHPALGSGYSDTLIAYALPPKSEDLAH